MISIKMMAVEVSRDQSEVKREICIAIGVQFITSVVIVICTNVDLRLRFKLVYVT